MDIDATVIYPKYFKSAGPRFRAFIQQPATLDALKNRYMKEVVEDRVKNPTTIITHYQSKLHLLERISIRYAPLAIFARKVIHDLKKNNGSDLPQKLITLNQQLEKNNCYAVNKENVHDLKAMAEGLELIEIVLALKDIEETFKLTPLNT